MISIAIINLKGGVGKSVTACNLAAELAAKSKSVLVVDLDKQGNTSKFFGVLDYDSPSVAEVMLGEDDILAAIVKGVDVWGVHLLPCDMRMLKANRAILNNCTAEVVEMLEKGEITMTRAYECSKLYKVQQVEYAKIKYASMPPITDMARRAAIKYLVECGLADQFEKLDYVRKSEWNYADRGLDTHKMEPVTLDLTEGETDALLRIEPAGYYSFRVRMLDPADANEVIAESSLSTRDLFDAAKRLYINKDDLAAYKAKEKSKRDQERARQDEAGKWQALARQELEAFDSWPLVTRLKDLGLTIRERKMADGGRLIIAVDDLARFSGHVNGFQYRECFAVRLGPNGERAGRDGDINVLELYKRWYRTGAGIEGCIAEDIQRAAREVKKK